MRCVLFIDLDGTLLDSKLEIPRENVVALEAAMLAGAEIVFSTGRPLASAKRLASQFGKINYLISSNGGCLADLQLSQAQCIASFTESDLDTLLEFGRSRGLAPILYTVDRILADSLSAEVFLEASRSGAHPEIVNSFPPDIVKILFVGQPMVVRNALTEVSKRPDILEAAVCYISYPEYLEMSPLRAGKLAAGQVLLPKLGRSWNDAITFGDSANDVELMLHSGTAVAVANATPDAKKVANIIAPSNDEAGVAAALRWLLFEDRTAKAKLRFVSRSQSSLSRNPSE